MVKKPLFKAHAYGKAINLPTLSEGTLPTVSQRGSILIGIIVTMVVMGVLGTGMLYMTTTSTFNELFFTTRAEALFTAESGGRYAITVIRDSYANDITGLNTINANQTFTLSNGSSFQIANWVQNGANPETVTFSSIGTVSAGFLQTKRQINYSIQPADQSAKSTNPPGYGEGVADLNTLPGNTNGSMQFETSSPGGDLALHVVKDQGGGTSSEAYVFAPAANPNPFFLNWGAAGNYSSYDLQVKIATGTPSGSSFTGAPTRYCNGLLFRGINLTGQRQSFLGLSIMRSSNEIDDMIANNMIPHYVPPDGTWTVWDNGIPYTTGDIVQYTIDGVPYYYECVRNHTSKSNNPDKKVPGDTFYWTRLPNDKPMIILWRRDGNQADGDDRWLAYKILDTSGTDYIVNSAGQIKPWSTIMVRLIEAASVKLTVSSAPSINIGDTITGGSGTAQVFRKINDNDGNVVLLLNVVTDTFSRPATIGTYNTDSSWGYRPRDNYIWAFYTDEAPHSSSATPLDNFRLDLLRGTIDWPIINVQDWASSVDRFSLVNWNTSLNTSLDSSLYILGTGKEAGAIIRTNKVDWLRSGPYTSETFPGEIGLVSLGATSELTYFDDLAYFLRGGFTSGGTDGSGKVTQSP